MKKLSSLLCGLAVLGMMFTSCNPEDKPAGPVTGFVEDGFYVVGEASAIATLQSEGAADAIMANGINENDNQTERSGMYEKYIALEGGKPFQLVLKKGETETVYGAQLDTVTLKGNDQPEITVQRGKMVEGATLQVPENGLYHIVLDLNLDGKLDSELILIAPVQWGYRGINNDWGFKAMNTPEFNKTSMTISSEEITVEAGCQFKFAYGGGWKIELDAEGTIKANTNIGNDAESDGEPLKADNLVPGGKNIALDRGVWKIDLVWTLAAGSINNSYTAKFNLVRTLEAADPATFVAGFSGDGVACGWNDPSGDALAVFNATETKVTDEATKTGTYVYDVASVAMEGGKEFKVRYNGAWLGAGNTELTIEGETFEGTDNFKIPANANYSVKFIVEWDGVASKATSIKVVFTKL